MKKNYVYKYLCFALAIVPFVVMSVSCGDSPSDLYFPIQKEPQTEFLLSILSGELVEDDGYLRVNDELIIWPYKYSVKSNNHEIWVINDKGEAVVKVGDTVKLGGGEISAQFVEEKIVQKLPAGIKGPYWLAGGIEKIN